MRLLVATLCAVAQVAGCVLAQPPGLGPTAEPIELQLPASAADVPVFGPLAVRINDPRVDREALRNGFALEPPAAGRLDWQGDTLLFRPDWPGLAPGIAYELRVPAGPDATPRVFHFTTVGRLGVTSAVPEDGAGDVATDATVFVQFNRPVVPLLTLEQQRALGDPNGLLRFDPPAAGTGRWLNTSLYTFKPSDAWQGGTTYRVTVPSTVADVLGGTMSTGDYTWSFSVAPPAVMAVTPAPNEPVADPSTPINITFNQRVDRAAAEAAFALRDASGQAVNGSLSWKDDRGLVFQPEQPLEAGASYVAGPGIGVVDGARTWRFSVAPLPRVLGSVPEDGGELARNTGVKITFSSPMDHTQVIEKLTIEPDLSFPPALSWSSDDRTLSLNGPFAPSASYRLSLPAGLRDRFGRATTEPFNFAFSTPKPIPTPQAWLVSPGRVGTYDAYGTPRAMVRTANVSRLTFTLETLSAEQFLAAISSPGPRTPGGTLDVSSPLRRWSVDVEPAEPNVFSLTRADLLGDDGQPLPPGYYRLDVRARENTQPAVQEASFAVTRTALTVKHSASGQVLAWAMDLRSGQPLAGLPVHLTSGSGARLRSSETDASGLARLDDPQAAGTLVAPPPTLYVLGERAGDAIIGSSAWSAVSAWSPGKPMSTWSPGPWVASLYTDRPIYRPGQTVHLKGILRCDDDAHYSLPPSDLEAAWEIADAQGRSVASAPVTFEADGFGTFSADVPLAEGALIGTYSARLKVGGANVGGASFQVAEYRRPDFEVTLGSDRPSVISGDAIPARLTAAYYFGRPLPAASTRWRVTVEPWSFTWKEAKDAPAPGFRFGDADADRPNRQSPLGPRAEGRGALALDGTLALSIPSDISGEATSQRFTIEATVTDSNDQEVSARLPVVVHQAGVYLGLKPERYVGQAGTPQPWSVVALDPQSQPLPGVPIQVQLVERTWLNVREVDPDGELRWQSRPQDTPVGKFGVTSGPDGRAQFSVTPPRPGQYRVVVDAADDQGRATRSAQTLWAWSTAASASYVPWRMSNDDRIELQADKAEYAPGDVARVLVPSPVADAVALVTVERGKLLSQRVRRLPGNSAVVEVPLSSEHVPNAYVSVVLFKGGSTPVYKVGVVELPVSTAEKRLQVSLEPDRVQHQPGDTVGFTVRTLDSAGLPVPAEVSLALVDAAVLALVDDQSVDPVLAFWNRRALRVRTGGSQSISIDRLNEAVASGNKGGGGGNEAGSRTQFQDTAFWAPSVHTDPTTGEAQVAVTLPDNLTTWRLVARAVTRETRLGAASTDVVSAKPLLLRPVVPRFLTAGDQVRLGAVVHNTTAEPLRVRVSLDGAAQTVDLAADGQQRVDWPMSVERGATQSERVLRFEALAADAGLRDAVEIYLPVEAWGSRSTVATAGQVSGGDVSEVVDLPDFAERDRGELDVLVAPSLAGALSYSLAYVEGFPYECLEQTVSRFLPRLSLYRAMSTAGLGDPLNLGHELPGLVMRSIQRMYAYQHPDGGWGWWRDDVSQPYLTAYGLFGLVEARRAGFAVDSGVIKRAADFLRRWLNDDPKPFGGDARAYALYVLGETGFPDPGRAAALFERRADLGLSGKAYLAQTLASVNAQDERVGGLLSELTDAAVTSATGSHWDEAQPNAWSFSTGTHTTAVVLDALIRLREVDKHPLVTSGVRWLMSTQRDGHWASTQESATTLLTLTDYLVASGELKARYQWDVSVNGSPVKQGDSNDEVAVPLAALRSGPNQVRLTRTPAEPGELYYTLQLHYYPPTEAIPAESHGVTVAREYLPLEGGDQQLEAASIGDLLKVRVTLIAPADLHHVVLEDPLPAGLEPVDTRLKISTLQGQQVLQAEAAAQRGQATRTGAWWLAYPRWSNVELRDRKVTLFASYLPRGTHTYEYVARASVAGAFRVLPTRAFEQYFPEVFARADGRRFRVDP
jgi:alpha-2-macroglobulin